MKSDSDSKDRGKIKLQIDKMGLVNRSNGNRGLCDSRVWREHFLECFSINVYSPGSKEMQKQSVNVMGNRTKNFTLNNAR